jgi:predicted Zn-dependent peptidase
VKASLFGLMLCVSGCAARAPEPVPVPTPPALSSALVAVDPLAEPPPPGLVPDAPFPAVDHQMLANGLDVRAVRYGNYPIVELRLVVLSGQGSDGPKTGLASVAGELLKAGGAGKWNPKTLVERAESLGTSLDILTTRERTQVSLSVTKHNFEAALEVLAAVALEPKFAPAEFGKLKQREIERVSSAARTSGRWMANMVLYRELYAMPTALHAYARYDATPEDFQKLTLNDCKTWHRQHFTPKNAFLVVAGDVDGPAAKAAVERLFGRWKGETPDPPYTTAPLPPEKTKVLVVDRPESAQSDVIVATLGVERKSPMWAQLAVTDQILGGGVAGRLFLDVREKRSLAYSTYSALVEVAHGPVPVILSAGTQTAKTGLAAQALLEHFEKIGASTPSDEETQIATKYLSDSFLLELDTVGSIAEMTAQLGVLGLPDDYYDGYRRAVRAVEPGDVVALAKKVYQPSHLLVVVAGDAERIARPLSHFGPVTIIDPEHGFAPGKTLPHDPTAKLEP